MKTQKYPRTLAAAKKGEVSLWEIGDALLEECPIDASHKHGLIPEAVEFLRENGCEYTEDTLVKLRAVAASFQPELRRHSSAFEVHYEAGTPQMLEAIVRGAPKGTVITSRYVRKVVQRIRDHERRKQEEAHAKAEAEFKEAEDERRRVQKEHREAKAADRPKLAAKSEEATQRVEKARKKAAATRRPPKKSTLPPPREEEVPVLVAESGFMANATEARRLARRSIEAISSCIDELTPKGVAALTDYALEAANAWTEAAQIVRKEIVDQRGHLSLVEN